MMRIEQLTFTRFLAATSIVIFHYGVKCYPFNNNEIAFIFKSADVGVSYFFILSGFVMMLAYGNRPVISVREYLINRLARIYPVYFFASLLMLLTQLRTNNLDVKGLFFNLFMIQAWFPDKVLSFNPPAWSLAVEFVFYLIFPFVFNQLFKKIALNRIVVFVVLFWIFSQLIFHTLYPLSEFQEWTVLKAILKYNPLMHLNEFLIGNLAGLCFIQKFKSKKANYDFLILLFAALVLLALKFPMGFYFHNGLLAILFIPLIIFLSLNNGLITRLFQEKKLVFLGEISYGIYILQHPVYSLISAYSVNKYLNISEPTIVFLIRFIILLILASLSYLFLEKPIQMVVRKTTRVKTEITF
ncbi:hypothetical protein B6A10_15470 [Flavobacterium sp. L1I52]|uniref:Acyltransferase 3 domain-containing protein n=1 Tax=Flavobacterium pokkalii TaxID=1940408 RepID=A0ABR7UUI7_9FLAO|nr:acyltransferase [Flavobacterium pokkalii]MBD0726572.1 hypothetical protein [Flavobacterium pokkalii]